jgi:hypothetical protein
MANSPLFKQAGLFSGSRPPDRWILGKHPVARRSCSRPVASSGDGGVMGMNPLTWFNDEGTVPAL